MRELLDDHRRGVLKPAPVRLGAMPVHARDRHRAIAGEIRLRLGLMRADLDERPLPFALSEVVNAGLAANRRQASDALSWLVRHRVIAGAGALKPLPGRAYGTRLYREPPPSGGGDGAAGTPDGAGVSGDEVLERLLADFDGTLVKDVPPAVDGDDHDPPCRFPRHRPSDWRGAGGRWTCGVCHPPVHSGARRDREHAVTR